MKEISFQDRLTVAGVADKLLDQGVSGNAQLADALLVAVRCCGEFPECSHVLAFVEEMDAGTPVPSPGEGS